MSQRTDVNDDESDKKADDEGKKKPAAEPDDDVMMQSYLIEFLSEDMNAELAERNGDLVDKRLYLFQLEEDQLDKLYEPYASDPHRIDWYHWEHWCRRCIAKKSLKGLIWDRRDHIMRVGRLTDKINDLNHLKEESERKIKQLDDDITRAYTSFDLTKHNHPGDVDADKEFIHFLERNKPV